MSFGEFWIGKEAKDRVRAGQRQQLQDAIETELQGYDDLVVLSNIAESPLWGEIRRVLSDRILRARIEGMNTALEPEENKYALAAWAGEIRGLDSFIRTVEFAAEELPRRNEKLLLLRKTLESLNV